MLEASKGTVLETKLKRSNVRWVISFMLFVAILINFADRSTISVAGSAIQKDLGISSISMGYIFSAFGWSYLVAQLPGGWFLDRYGSKIVYAFCIFFWSLFTLLQGFTVFFAVSTAVVVLFAFRLLVGFAEAPAFPANIRITASWFPIKERGTATSFFNSAQYFATALFAPIFGWVTNSFGWTYNFVLMGVLGIFFCFVWMKVVHNSPKQHPNVNQAELEYVERGGALVNMDQRNKNVKGNIPKGALKQLLKNRMLLGIYIAQYGITTLNYFFLTWFPVYLVQQRGMSILKAGFFASLPALCGFLGCILAGMFTDFLLRKGFSLSVARKVPIVSGMLLAMSLIIANYTNSDWIVVAVMSMAFFVKGFGALGYTVISDASPKEIVGLSSGLLNTFGNVAAVTTPIIIGYIVQGSGSFNGALVFVGLNAFAAIFCYLFVVGEIKRVNLKKA